MEKNNVVWFSLLSLILLAGCIGGASSNEPTLVPTPIVVEKPIYAVQRGVVTRVVQLTGRVTPIQQQDLFFRSDGFVKEVLAATGDTVTEGQVLARLDEPERYQADVAAAELAEARAIFILQQAELEQPIKLAEARMALNQARTNLQEAKNLQIALRYPHVTDALTLEKIRSELAIANQNLSDAQARYDSLYGRPEIDFERLQALNGLIEARRQQYLAQLNLDWAEGKITQAEIDQVQIDVDLAQGIYDKAAAEVEYWQTDNPVGEVFMSKLALADAEARLALARKSLEAVELRAPFAGQVLSLGIAPGSSVKSFQAVLTLADPARLEIRAIPAAEDLNLLGIGQSAVVRLSSQQGKDLTAKITGLPLVLSTTSSTGSQDTSVHLTLDESDVLLQLGDAATILVTIDTRENVIWLPPAAIRTFQGENFVFVESGGLQRRVNVTLGLNSGDRVEIVSGLEEGQSVVGQ